MITIQTDYLENVTFCYYFLFLRVIPVRLVNVSWENSVIDQGYISHLTLMISVSSYQLSQSWQWIDIEWGINKIVCTNHETRYLVGLVEASWVGLSQARYLFWRKTLVYYVGSTTWFPSLCLKKAFKERTFKVTIIGLFTWKPCSSGKRHAFRSSHFWGLRARKDK